MTSADLQRKTLVRFSLLQRVELPELTISSNGVSLKGYANDGGSAIVGAAVSAAVSAASKAK